jgi:hypothetical protein
VPRTESVALKGRGDEKSRSSQSASRGKAATKAAAAESSLSRQPLCRWPRQKHAVASRETARRARHCASLAHTLRARQLLRVQGRARGSRPAARTQTGSPLSLFWSLSRDFVVQIILFELQAALVVHAFLCSKNERKKALTFWDGNRFPFQVIRFPFQDRLETRHEDDFAKTCASRA